MTRPGENSKQQKKRKCLSRLPRPTTGKKIVVRGTFSLGQSAWGGREGKKHGAKHQNRKQGQFSPANSSDLTARKRKGTSDLTRIAYRENKPSKIGKTKVWTDVVLKTRQAPARRRVRKNRVRATSDPLKATLPGTNSKKGEALGRKEGGNYRTASISRTLLPPEGEMGPGFCVMLIGRTGSKPRLADRGRALVSNRRKRRPTLT